MKLIKKVKTIFFDDKIYFIILEQKRLNGIIASNETYEYYNGKNGKYIKHGICKYFYNQGILKYKHNKLYGECIYYRAGKIIKTNYVKGALEGSYIISNLGGQVKSVRFYNNGRKCCSIRNDYEHYDEGMKLMGWKERKRFQNI